MINITANLKGVEESLLGALESAVLQTLEHENAEGGVNVMLTGDEEVRALNRAFRGIDTTTDVLSFAANEGEELLGEPAGFLGDIAISLPRAQSQAEAYGHSLKRELCFLAVHGTLHLMGYDHANEAEESEMFALQEKILEDMGLKR